MLVQVLLALSLTSIVSVPLVPWATKATNRSLALVLTGTLNDVIPELRVFWAAAGLTEEGPAAVPVPVRLTICGLSLALSLMVMLPVRVPVAVGVKVTLMLQLPPAATALPQVLLWL